ncbi:hypothetical protein SAMN04488134_11353 [Amphibacillus marinus]|uniref:Uncharacterized protein n=1 Tax=Amphibacillus marinus TaxID=872970 RepID=A0A1H8SPM3_9BACI|nr:hypothetical protein [Amphibacillus marinus]SEO80278.1 hypothetical protein SAMN04488134_11353 [Amphibacillus marinus]
MGIITRAFGNLFDLLWSVGEWILSGIGSFFQFFIDLFLGFVNVIFDVIRGLLYLLYMIGVLAIRLFQVLLEAAQILWSLIVGFGNTLASLAYSPRGSGGHGYSETIGQLFDALEPMQLSPIAYILSFALWFITAISAMKLISSIRVGGS